MSGRSAMLHGISASAVGFDDARAGAIRVTATAYRGDSLARPELTAPTARRSEVVRGLRLRRGHACRDLLDAMGRKRRAHLDGLIFEFPEQRRRRGD